MRVNKYSAMVPIIVFAQICSVNFCLAANLPTGKPLTEVQRRFEKIMDVNANFGQSSEQLITRFGEPPLLVKYPAPDPHNPTDKPNLHIEIHYPGAYFQLLRVQKHIDPNAEFYESITLIDESWELPLGLHVSVKRDKVVGVLGKPYISKKMMDVYNNYFKAYTNPMDANYYQGLYFFYRDNVVEKILFEFEID